MTEHKPTITTHSLTTGYASGRERKIITEKLDSVLLSGELVSLLGPNGAGKSTLLRTLAGFQPPLEGEMKIMGKNPSSYSSKERARMMSIVLTEKPILENMDVEALVGLGRIPYTNFWGHLGKEDREIVNESLHLIGIDDLRHRQVQSLSDGERQKVMIAKALAQATPIIFLDEPTAFIDYPGKVEIMILLHNLARNLGKTIFMSTHDLDIALQTSDKIWLIDKKSGVTTGTHSQLTESGALEKYFQRPGIRFDYSDGLFKIDL